MILSALCQVYSELTSLRRSKNKERNKNQHLLNQMQIRKLVKEKLQKTKRINREEQKENK